MKTSQAGIDLIKEFEGCELKAYRDAVGVLTIGYGHTMGVCEGDEITEAIADIYLRTDLKDAEQCVTNTGAQLSQFQFDALVSFTFNLGCGNLRKSTLLRKVLAGEYEDAAQEFLKWNMAGGRVLAGLARRREAERKMFMGESA